MDGLPTVILHRGALYLGRDFDNVFGAPGWEIMKLLYSVLSLWASGAGI